MAELTQTRSQIGLKSNEGAATALVQFGESSSPGSVVYQDTSTGKWYKCTSASAAASKAGGITVGDNESNGYGLIYLPGCKLDVGATLAVGTMYAIGATTAGAIGPESDLGTGKYPCTLGYATAADTLDFAVGYAGVAKP